MTAYIIMNSCNAFTGIGTTDYEKAKKTIKELNSTAKKANNGMRFLIKDISIDDNDYDMTVNWWKELF